MKEAAWMASAKESAEMAGKNAAGLKVMMDVVPVVAGTVLVMVEADTMVDAMPVATAVMAVARGEEAIAAVAPSWAVMVVVARVMAVVASAVARAGVETVDEKEQAREAAESEGGAEAALMETRVVQMLEALAVAK